MNKKAVILPTIGTAGWSIPATVAKEFPADGSGLSRYAAVFDGVEINSTFYRKHQPKTLARWAASVPDHFRFAVKLPQEISHRLRLSDIGTAFRLFCEMISPLETKLGPLLCQLPPSLEFDERLARTAFEHMREVHSGPLVMEARHTSWRSDAARELFVRYEIGRVLADPAPVWTADDFTDPPGYVRLHGKPKIYYSSYTEAEITSFLQLLASDSWCVFDNTASGAAISNALMMRAQTQLCSSVG